MKSFMHMFFLISVATSGQTLTQVDDDEKGISFVNEKGVTVIPFGKYVMSFVEQITIKNVGKVIDQDGKILGIDNKGNVLYEIFNYDNGPDYSSDGLFRIIKNGKMGYANEDGKIIIQPKYTCAKPFEDGYAEVSVDVVSEKTSEGEYADWGCEKWFYIDKKGVVRK